MRKDEPSRGLGGQASEVRAVPGGNGGSKDAGVGPKVGRGVVTDAEAVTIVGTAGVLGWYMRRSFINNEGIEQRSGVDEQ